MGTSLGFNNSILIDAEVEKQIWDNRSDETTSARTFSMSCQTHGMKGPRTKVLITLARQDIESMVGKLRGDDHKHVPMRTLSIAMLVPMWSKTAGAIRTAQMLSEYWSHVFMRMHLVGTAPSKMEMSTQTSAWSRALETNNETEQTHRTHIALQLLH
jgi:hypothetical protein